MEKNKGNIIWKIASIFSIAAVIIISCVLFTKSNVTPINDVSLEKEKALLSVEIYDMASNIDNEDELIFTYWIMNYGSSEAKNLITRCNVFETIEGKSVVSSTYTKKDGNVASRTANYEEMIGTKDPNFDYEKEYSFVCYPESCDNCEILYKRIPHLVESYLREYKGLNSSNE